MRYLSVALIVIFFLCCGIAESPLVKESVQDTVLTVVPVNADTQWIDMDSVLLNATLVMEADVDKNSGMKAHSWFRNIRNDSVYCIEGDMDMTYTLSVNERGDTIQCGHWPRVGTRVLVVARRYDTRSTTNVSLFASREDTHYRFWDPYHMFMRPTYFAISDSVLPVPEFADEIIVHNGRKYCPDGCLYPVSEVKMKD